MTMIFDIALLTNPGGRNYNEDYATYILVKDMGCFILADGLGGHRGGRLAARLACQSIKLAFKHNPGVTTFNLKSYIELAASKLDWARKKYNLVGAAKTTLVVMLADQSKAVWAHIGDSRLYHFKSGELVYQTKDHSLTQKLADIGDITVNQIRSHEDRNLLLAVFEEENLSQVKYAEKLVDIDKNDAFLLCSDGLWEYVYEAEMEADLKASTTSEIWLKAMENRLSERVSNNNDNYTAIAVIFREEQYNITLKSIGGFD